VGLGGAFESGLYARYFDNPGAEKYPYEGDMIVKLFLEQTLDTIQHLIE
jgi:hypothetical protein